MGDFGALVMGAGGLACLLALGRQVLTYLQDGVWIPYSVINFLQGAGVQWAINPESWLGLHAILDFINFGAACLIGGLVVGITLANLEDF